MSLQKVNFLLWIIPGVRRVTTESTHSTWSGWKENLGIECLTMPSVGTAAQCFALGESGRMFCSWLKLVSLLDEYSSMYLPVSASAGAIQLLVTMVCFHLVSTDQLAKQWVQSTEIFSNSHPNFLLISIQNTASKFGSKLLETGYEKTCFSKINEVYSALFWHVFNSSQ